MSRHFRRWARDNPEAAQPLIIAIIVAGIGVVVAAMLVR